MILLLALRNSVKRNVAKHVIVLVKQRLLPTTVQKHVPVVNSAKRNVEQRESVQKQKLVSKVKLPENAAKQLWQMNPKPVSRNRKNPVTNQMVIG